MQYCLPSILIESDVWQTLLMSKNPDLSENGGKAERKRATSYDVAELAGVSQSAVSRVFQDGASASKVMRNRVMAAADQLGYRPNAIARGLITQQSNMVAVVISKLTNLYYPEVLVQLTQRFSERGVRVLLFALEHEGDTESVIEQMLQYRVDGVLTAAMFTPKQLDTINNAHIPVVFYNRSQKDQLVSSVRCDQEEGERWLVEGLVNAGHKSFGIVEGPPDSIVSMQRKTGALTKLKELDITDITTVSGDFGYSTGRQCFSRLVEKHGSPPDAVIAANDVMAIGCIDEARESFGLAVPERISVVGFDGVGQARYAAYDVTTVRQPVQRMTSAAASMLMERIENLELSPEKRAFSGSLIRGGSARFQPDVE
jgi:DNA-binding LacI/PurR family transcriptional regulator